MAALQELLDCRISAWYPQFARVTFKTALLPLPQPVLDWLVSDGLHLPADSQAVSLELLGMLAQAWRASRRHRHRLPPPCLHRSHSTVCQARPAGGVSH